LLAIGLVILWLVGLSQHATAWLTWLDVVGALFGFAIAAGAGPQVARGFAGGAPIALAIGLGVLWIIGLATHAEAWLTWWTFAFACAFLLLGIGGSFTRRPVLRTTEPRPV
jgi:hypothetical protein